MVPRGVRYCASVCCYAERGTELAYGVVGGYGGHSGSDVWEAHAAQVLTALSPDAPSVCCYAAQPIGHMDLAYAAMLVWCYATSSTEIAYGATRHEQSYQAPPPPQQHAYHASQGLGGGGGGGGMGGTDSPLQ
eukprot:2729216-Rhodomonas_salina.1